MKDVVNIRDLEMRDPPGPHRRLVGVMLGREETPTIDMRAVIIILPVGEEQPKGRNNIHDKAEEIYYVLRGKGQFVFNEERVVDIEQGTAVYVAPGTDHRVINTGDEQMELYAVMAPASGGGPAVGLWSDLVKDWKQVPNPFAK